MSPGTIGFSGEQTRSINPDSDYNELILELTPEDMIKYGLIPEFAGRLPGSYRFNGSTKMTYTRSCGSPRIR